MKRTLIATALALAFVAPVAHADETILVFGEASRALVVNGVANASDCSVIGPTCQTTINVDDGLVTVTAIDSSDATPFNAFLSLDVTSTDAAITGFGFLAQSFAGMFCITSGINCGGTNFLSATFTDITVGRLGSAGLTMSAGDPPGSIIFTSDVITTLLSPTGLAFSFTGVTPGVSTCGTGGNTTLCSFVANVAGDMSATAALVPEPATAALAALGLAGLGFGKRKRPQHSGDPLPV